MKRSMTAVLALTIALAMQPALADSDPQAQVEERLNQAKERLNLTDEQVRQIQPIMQSAMETQQEVLSRYGIDLQSGERPQSRLGLREARKLRGEMTKVRSDTLKQLDGILTEEQLAEFKKMQEENRQAMQQRMRGGR